MRKWLWIGGTILAVVAVAGGVTWYLWPHEDLASKSGVQGWSKELRPDATSGPVAPLNPEQSGAPGMAQGTPLPLKVGSGTTTAAPGGNGVVSGTSNSEAQANAVPGPAEFGQYEKYKDQPAALYMDLRLGTGEAAAAGKTVVADYRGWLTNGQEFDESYVRGKPFAFKLGDGKVIQGWEQGILGMKVGGKRRLIVPATVGYGAQALGTIPANSMLIFDVELQGLQ